MNQVPVQSNTTSFIVGENDVERATSISWLVIALNTHPHFDFKAASCTLFVIKLETGNSEVAKSPMAGFTASDEYCSMTA